MKGCVTEPGIPVHRLDLKAIGGGLSHFPWTMSAKPHCPLGGTGWVISCSRTVDCGTHFRFISRRLLSVWQVFLSLPEHDLGAASTSRMNPAEIFLWKPNPYISRSGIIYILMSPTSLVNVTWHFPCFDIFICTMNNLILNLEQVQPQIISQFPPITFYDTLYWHPHDRR